MIDKKAKRWLFSLDSLIVNNNKVWCVFLSALSLRIFGKDITTAGREAEKNASEKQSTDGGPGAEATTAIVDTKPDEDVKMESGDEDHVKEKFWGCIDSRCARPKITRAQTVVSVSTFHCLRYIILPGA